MAGSGFSFGRGGGGGQPKPARTPLQRCAADHIARLLRLYGLVESRLQAAGTAATAAKPPG